MASMPQMSSKCTDLSLAVLNEPIAHKTQGPPAGPEKPLLHTQSLSAMFKAPTEELGGHARHAVAFMYGPDSGQDDWEDRGEAATNCMERGKSRNG
jgi:hypothetical protein